MAKLTTIDELLNDEIENGMVIPSITGKLTKLFKATETSYGFLQNGELTDEQGSVCRICFADTTQEMSARGKIIHLESNNGDHGFQGVKRKDDKQGNIQIWVTGSATITYPAGAGGSGNAGQQRQQTSKPTTGQQNTRSQTSTGSAGQNRPTSNMHPLTRLKDLADLEKTCFRLVNENVGELLKDRPELLVNMAVSLFIQADRTGIAAAWDASTVHKKQLPPPPTDPSKWEECYIRSGKHEGETLKQINDDDLMAFFNYYDEKGANDPFAECVYQAARDRKLLKPPVEDKSTEKVPLDQQDDIPF